jgi:hypothetical protein
MRSVDFTVEKCYSSDVGIKILDTNRWVAIRCAAKRGGGGGEMHSPHYSILMPRNRMI